MDAAKTVAALTGVDKERLGRVRDLIDRDIEAGIVDGISLVVRRSGQLVLDEHRGFADRESGRALTPDAVFATQSLGKQFFNTVFLSYVERGLIDLAAPVAEVLPKFGIRGKEGVTPFHLLTHTGGIQSLIPALPLEELIKSASVAEHAFLQRPESRPGERVTYSLISAHAVLGEMLLEVDGRRRSLRTLLDEELFRPLGMLGTSLGIRPDLLERLVTIVSLIGDEPGFYRHDEMVGNAGLLTLPDLELPGGGYFTTSSDLVRFVEMLRRGGELDGVRIISPAMLEWATRNHTGDLQNDLWNYAVGAHHWSPVPANIGVGFFTRGEGITHGPLPLLGSPGTFGGWGVGSTSFWVDPQRDLSFILLAAGVTPDHRFVERSRRLGDAVIAALV